jgi:Domain of unknown function (DUF4070)
VTHEVAWQQAHGFPFEFSTEASINIADDGVLLRLMRECGFFTIFVGIESPDPDTLIATKKKQNTRRSLVDSLQKIYAEGMFVTAGFILGLDGEKGSIADPMTNFIEEATIPVSNLGLLCALPNTQLTRRLAQEDRLFEGYDLHPDGAGDQCIRLNFETSRPRRKILDDYCRVLSRIYDPAAFCARVERLISTLNVRLAGEDHPADNFRRRHGIETVRRIVNRFPEYREVVKGATASVVAGSFGAHSHRMIGRRSGRVRTCRIRLCMKQYHLPRDKGEPHAHKGYPACQPHPWHRPDMVGRRFSCRRRG